MSAAATLSAFRDQFEAQNDFGAILPDFTKFIRSKYADWLPSWNALVADWNRLKKAESPDQFLANHHYQQQERFRESILKWINELIAYGRRAYPAQDPKDDQLSLFGIGTLPIIRRFLAQFDENESGQKRAQFFFLNAPGLVSGGIGLINRMIALVKEEVVDVKYPGINHLPVTPLHLLGESGPSIHQAQFLRAFNRDLEPNVEELKILDLLVNFQYPHLRSYDYLPFVFHLKYSGDIALFEPFLEWLTQQFAFIPHYTDRRYLFFFLFEEQNFRSPFIKILEQKQIAFAKAYKHRGIGLTQLPALTTIPKAELTEWINQHVDQELRSDYFRRIDQRGPFTFRAIQEMFGALIPSFNEMAV